MTITKQTANLDDIWDDEPETTQPPKRKPGRPPGSKNSNKPKKVTTTVAEYDEEDPLENLAPIFAETSNADRIDRITLFRRGPWKEGLIGQYGTDLSLEDIRNEHGGGTYHLQGKDQDGRIVVNRAVQIGGDPKYQSKALQRKWDQENGAKNDGALNPIDLLRIVDEREQRSREMLAHQEEERRRLDQEAYERRRREEREWEERKERERREYEDRKRREEEDRDRKRREWEEERDRRLRAEQEEREARERREREESEARRMERERSTIAQSQDFYKSMLQMQQTQAVKADPMDQFGKMVTVFATMKEAFGAEGGGDTDNPWMALVQNLPKMLQSAAPAVGRAISEVRGGAPPPIPNPGRPAQAAPGLQLPPELAGKMRLLAEKWVMEGEDPEAKFHQVADILLSDGATEAPEPALPPTSSQSPAEPSRTTPAKASYPQRRVISFRRVTK